MSNYADNDTINIPLSPEELKIVGATPEAKVEEPPKEATSEETVSEPPKESIPEVSKDITPKAKVEEPKVNKVREAFVKKTQQNKEEIAPLSEDERARLEKYESQEAISAEKKAYYNAMDGYSDEELAIISPELQAIISSEEYNKFAELTPDQRAVAVIALAEKSMKAELQELRAKMQQAKVDQATKEVTAREKVKEITDVEVKGSEEETAPAKRASDLYKSAVKGDEDALNRLILGNDRELLKQSGLL